MKNKQISNVITLRIRNVDLFDKLQFDFNGSKFDSFNEYLNYLLGEIAFKKNNEFEIIERLESVEDKVNAIYEMVKEKYAKQE